MPYEQYTQQSPGFGLSRVLQCSHAQNQTHASVGMVSLFMCPHTGHVMVDSRTIAFIALHV